MSLVGFQGQNHPQQVGKRGAKPHVDNLATTPEMFAPLHERFRFTLDAAALPHNAKLERYFAPPDYTQPKCMWLPECEPNCPCPNVPKAPVALDGLARSWAGERVWCNPPYSNIWAWVEKAWAEWDARRTGLGAGLIVMLLPANRTEQAWWQQDVEPGRLDGRLRVEFLPGRPRFIKHGYDRVEPNQRPPFGCCLLIWGDSGALERKDRPEEAA